MLFKLISNGRITRAELDGQILGRGLKAITFSHSIDGDENNCRLNLEFDLSVGKNENTRDVHVFVPSPPGKFIEEVRSFEDYAAGKDEINL